MLHPQAQAFIDRIAQAETPSFRKLGVEAIRAMAPKLNRLAGKAEPVTRVANIDVPGDVPVCVRHYSPVQDEHKRPTLVYAHGGGWALGDLDGIDPTLRALANRSGWDIVSVEYRLAPEHPFPAASQDLQSVLRWVAQSASVMAIGGDSGGGALAIQAALKWNDSTGVLPIDLLLAIYPALDDDLDRPSYQENSAYGMSRDDAEWFLSLYLPDGVDRSGALPLKAPSLQKLPQTFVLSAEYDILIDEAGVFVERLRKEGVTVEHHVQLGMIHGYLQLGAIMDATEESVKILASQLRAVKAPALKISPSKEVRRED